MVALVFVDHKRAIGTQVTVEHGMGMLRFAESQEPRRAPNLGVDKAIDLACTDDFVVDERGLGFSVGAQRGELLLGGQIVRARDLVRCC